MRIVISTLFFYRPELCREFVDALLPSLNGHCARTGNEIELLITDNTPPGHSILGEVRDLIQARRVELDPRLQFKFRMNGFNRGFGASHSQAFAESAAGDRPVDAFIVLNNDLFIADPDWVAKLCAPLTEEKVALVGVASSPRILGADGEGTYGIPENPRNSDYAEASILAVQPKVAAKFGLFAPDLPWAYFEDSDLSLRYSQLGFELRFVDIPHEHRRGSSSALLGEDRLEAIRGKNQVRFLARWQRYLRNRRFENTMFLDFVSSGWGDVVAAIPTVTGLLRDHPTAQIHLQTSHRALAGILAFPRVTIETEKFVGMEEIRNVSRKYDRVFSLSDVDYSSPLYLGRQIALDAGVAYDLPAARAQVLARLPVVQSEAVVRVLSEGRPICVVHAEYIRKDWEGRGVPVGALRQALEGLKARGYLTVLVGSLEAEEEYRKFGEHCDVDLCGQASLSDLFTVFSRASVFLGIDSGPLHIAQLFGVPSFAVFGATLACSRLADPLRSYGYSREGLDCLGCYHQLRSAKTNYCLRRDEACVKQLDSAHLRSALEAFLDGKVGFSGAAWEAERKVLETKQTAWSKYHIAQRSDLSRFRLRELAVALRKKVVRAALDRLR